MAHAPKKIKGNGGQNGLLSFGSLTVSLHRKSPRVKKGCEWMVDGKEDEWKVTSSERLVNGGWEKISEKR